MKYFKKTNKDKIYIIKVCLNTIHIFIQENHFQKVSADFSH